MTKERPQREHFTFVHPLRVRWAEVDAQGIVFNPHYFAYADVAMTEYLRALGYPYPKGLLELGSDLFAVRAEAEYVSSARYDDVVDLANRVEYIGRTSLRFRTAIFRAEELLTELRITYVNASPADKKPVTIPAALIDSILAFERHPVERKT